MHSKQNDYRKYRKYRKLNPHGDTGFAMRHLQERPMARLTEYKDMNPRAKAVVEGIATARGIDPATINNVWKALARHPSVMEPLQPR